MATFTVEYTLKEGGATIIKLDRPIPNASIRSVTAMNLSDGIAVPVEKSQSDHYVLTIFDECEVWLQMMTPTQLFIMIDEREEMTLWLPDLLITIEYDDLEFI